MRHGATITTKYLGPTNYRGERIKARWFDESITVPWDYGIGPSENHDAAALALARKLGFPLRSVTRGDSGGPGYVYLFPPDQTDPMAGVYDALFPGGELDHEWSADTLDTIAEIAAAWGAR